jgi:hypothetical protein
MEDFNNIVAFKSICSFVKDLSDMFGNNNRPLALYNRLLEKTAITHDQAIEKNVSVFHKFVVTNRDAIIERQIDCLAVSKIEYSERIFIDLLPIYMKADKDAKDAIEKHLLAICAIVDPASNAKKLLMETLKSTSSGDADSETKFISDIISKVEGAIDPEKMNDPMQAVTSIMQSGVFNELVTSMSEGINSGSLNLGRLIGSMQGMMGDTGMPQGGMPGMPDMNSLISMMNMIQPPAKK